MVVCSLRNAALVDESSPQDLATRICESYVRSNCDSLVLPLIDNRGISLPVGEIVDRLRLAGRTPRQVVVDASQAIGHIPINLASLKCDFLICGAHKWVGGYHPLGIGVLAGSGEAIAQRALRSDPILRLTHEANGSLAIRHGETAAILPLLTAAGAISDFNHFTVEQRLANRVANRRRLVSLLLETNWYPIRVDAQPHGIVLARPPATRMHRRGVMQTRQFRPSGIALTCYENGLVRFSLPDQRFTQAEEFLILRALKDRSRRPEDLMLRSHAGMRVAST